MKPTLLRLLAAACATCGAAQARDKQASAASYKQMCFESEQAIELTGSQTCGADNRAERERIHRIMAGNNHNTLAVGHYNVLALARDAETGLRKALTTSR